MQLIPTRTLQKGLCNSKVLNEALCNVTVGFLYFTLWRKKLEIFFKASEGASIKKKRYYIYTQQKSSNLLVLEDVKEIGKTGNGKSNHIRVTACCPPKLS